MEALVRWNHAQAGEVPPATVVGIAERTGLIGTLTFWILNAALRQAAQWREAGIRTRLAINLSIATLTDRELPAVVDQSIKTWNLPPESIVLEIAESSMIVDAERSVAILTRLKAIGVQLSIDDFGSGYSSLAQLRRLPLDELKIDRPFVSAFLTHKPDRAVVRSAIDIAHHFGLRVVAEGVESGEARAELARLGCDIAQGHWLSPALPDARLREWWAANASGT
jgi:EAL domain-containing protein (putative c-di-GMP-specific phosphodiesterase class I)